MPMIQGCAANYVHVTNATKIKIYVCYLRVALMYRNHFLCRFDQSLNSYALFEHSQKVSVGI